MSEEQADTIEHDALLTDRVKTNNKQVINNISVINSAMKRDKVHEPEKINFKYLKSTINDISQQVERKKGERYIVSPYKLLINDGNYYLLAFDENSQQMRTYRVDRMKDVRSLFCNQSEGLYKANVFHVRWRTHECQNPLHQFTLGYGLGTFWYFGRELREKR